MADISKNTSTLTLVAEFTDGDDRTINLDNPKNGLTASVINACASYAPGVLIGDKYSSDFYRFKSAKVTKRRTTYLDLNDPN